jgi:bifunctional DNase/RNase
MKLKELKIVGLSYSQTQVGSYIVVLSEKRGKKKLPIVINQDCAQYITLKLEGVKVKKPLTHDLFKIVSDKLGADLYQIQIINIIEGSFYVKLIFHNMVEEFEIESTISDALSLSVAYKCPIMCSDGVLDVASILMDDDGNIDEEQDIENHKKRGYEPVTNIENLEKMLNKAIQSEEYEIASQLRDRIVELKESDKK